MNPDKYSPVAIAAGAFGDIWQGLTKDGRLMAVKCLRLHLMVGGDKQGMKARIPPLCRQPSDSKHSLIPPACDA